MLISELGVLERNQTRKQQTMLDLYPGSDGVSIEN